MRLGGAQTRHPCQSRSANLKYVTSSRLRRPRSLPGTAVSVWPFPERRRRPRGQRLRLWAVAVCALTPPTSPLCRRVSATPGASVLPGPVSHCGFDACMCPRRLQPGAGPCVVRTSVVGTRGQSHDGCLPTSSGGLSGQGQCPPSAPAPRSLPGRSEYLSPQGVQASAPEAFSSDTRPVVTW